MNAVGDPEVRERLVARLRVRYGGDPAIESMAPILAAEAPSAALVDALARRLLALEKGAPG